MRQKTPLRRTRFKAKKKDPAKVKAWRAVKEALWVRAEGRCEWCGGEAHDAHHVKKRSQGGGGTLDNLTCLCRSCHSATDSALGHGRLAIIPWRSPRYGYGFRLSQGTDWKNIGPFTDEDTP